MCDRCAEHRHDGVADVLFDSTRVTFDDAVDDIAETPHQSVKLFGIDLAGYSGEADDVGKQYGNLTILGRIVDV